MSENDISPQNVLVINFPQDASAYKALTTLKELNSQGQLELVDAAVVARAPDGHVDVKDEVGDEDYAGTATGGIVGLVVGILGGPLGVLIGGATGLIAGSLYDLDDVDHSDSVLGEISKSVRVGQTEVIAQVVEQSPDVVDSAMARDGGTVMRRPSWQVTAEIAAAQEAQREAKQAARKELHKARHEKHKHEADEKVAELKTKLHHDKAPTATSS